MPIPCSNSQCTSNASIKRAKDGAAVCGKCFSQFFEEVRFFIRSFIFFGFQDVHNTIISTSLFKRNEKVAIGASGGKDSTVLAYVMKTLNDRYDYGLDLVLLSIDEGIKGYRDDSLKVSSYFFKHKYRFCNKKTSSFRQLKEIGLNMDFR